MKFIEKLIEEVLEVGDEILMGKWKNKKAFIKEFGTDKNNQPTVITDKGERSMYAFRVKKFMEGPSASEKYQDFFRGKLKKYEVGSPKRLPRSEQRAFWKELKADWAEEKERAKKEDAE